MKLNVLKKPNPYKILDITSELKKLIEPIQTQNNDLFIDQLLSKPHELLEMLVRGYSYKDHTHFGVSCLVKCNIPLEFSAKLGNRANC